MPTHIDTDNKDSVYSFRSVDACYLECFVCMCLLLLLLFVCLFFIGRITRLQPVFISFEEYLLWWVRFSYRTKNHACLQFARRISASEDHVFML